MINRDSGFIGDYWFEGTQYIEQLEGVALCTTTGVYEVLLQDSGNLKFVLVEDECPGRISDIAGSGSVEGEIEWKPVP
jgi:hypothetical protein